MKTPIIKWMVFLQHPEPGWTRSCLIDRRPRADQARVLGRTVFFLAQGPICKANVGVLVCNKSQIPLACHILHGISPYYCSPKENKNFTNVWFCLLDTINSHIYVHIIYINITDMLTVWLQYSVLLDLIIYNKVSCKDNTQIRKKTA